MVLCAVACRTPPPTIPGATPGNPQGVCRQTQVTGTRILGATLVHGATFYMLMIDACGTDLTKLAEAARACQDRSDCGVPLSPEGQTEVNDALSSLSVTPSPVLVGGGLAFQGRSGKFTLVEWDASRTPQQVIAAVNQGAATGASPVACCPGCAACHPATAGAKCTGAPPRVDKAPAPGFLPLPGPAVCTCDAVCAAKANKQVPADCDCARLCQCP
ncbi:MAG: hypothetical protein E6J91_17535 [Deltaproteobacteria bacterium]|nr:MAG: hypothetical protein E6J91_17535 [Deltaproteobacteria bacterium]